jgi:hypothetical protein
MANIFAKMREDYKPTYLRSEPSVNCCGANFAAYFPQGSEKDYEMLKPTIKKELAWLLKNNNNSMMLVILNHHQTKYFDEEVKACGFRTLMRDVYHSGHGNNLTLYGWEKYDKRVPTGEPA